MQPGGCTKLPEGEIMKYITAIAITLAASFAHAEMGESSYRDENRAVASGAYNNVPVTGPARSGEEITNDRYCADRPERCAYEAKGKRTKRRSHGANLVPSPSYCSNAGDQVARPVYREVKGQIVLAGFECIQDNRGSN